MSATSIFSGTNPEIYVVTTAHDGQWAGQVATWVTVASLVPEKLRVVVILSPYTHTSSVLSQSQAFVLNLVAADQPDWLVTFGMQSGHNHDKFQGIDVALTPSGLPILPNTYGWALCQVSQHLDLGDRILWVADVMDQHCNVDKQPLRRIEALGSLPDEIRQQLLQQRLQDIERDRPLRF